MLGRRGKHLEDYFFSPAARRADNLDGIAWEDSPEGLPFLHEAMLNIGCSVRAIHRAGDHSLFVASIDRTAQRHVDQPLTSQDLAYVYVGEVVRRLVPQVGQR